MTPKSLRGIGFTPENQIVLIQEEGLRSLWLTQTVVKHGMFFNEYADASALASD